MGRKGGSQPHLRGVAHCWSQAHWFVLRNTAVTAETKSSTASLVTAKGTGVFNRPAVDCRFLHPLKKQIAPYLQWFAGFSTSLCTMIAFRGTAVPGGVGGGHHDVEVRLVLVEDELLDERRPGDELRRLEVHCHAVYVLQERAAAPHQRPKVLADPLLQLWPGSKDHSVRGRGWCGLGVLAFPTMHSGS